MKDAFEAELVSFEGGDGFLEEFFGVLVAGVDTRDVYLFPFYWDVVGFEDGFDRLGYFGANTVTWEGNEPLGR